jgi:serine/threonine protein kinase
VTFSVFNSWLGKEWSSVSLLAKDFIKKLLMKHPKERISAKDCLNDPWIRTFTEKAKIAKPICLNALSMLKNFNCERKLEAAVVVYISNSISTSENKEALLQIFKELDTDCNG